MTAAETWAERIQFWFSSHIIGRLPVVVVRRTTLDSRERNAFELGRDYGRTLSDSPVAIAFKLGQDR